MPWLLIIRTNIDVQNQCSPKRPAWIFPSGALYLRRSIQRKNQGTWSLRQNPENPKWPETNFFHTSWCSTSSFCLASCSTVSIKVIFDSFILVEWSSKGSCSFGDFFTKCRLRCRGLLFLCFIVVQTHVCLKFSASLFPTWSHSKTFF